MSFQNDAPIIQKVYDFFRELYLAVEKMPKKDKYTLGEKLQSVTLVLFELLTASGNFTRTEKLPYLNKASIKLDLLKMLVRLAQEIKAIDNKKYFLLEEKLQEIGKMLGGWIRSLK